MTIAAVDIETNDPNLNDLGVGALRGDGEILTVGIYCPEWNIDGWYTWQQFLEDGEAQELLRDKDITKVFHNGLYDLEWLCEWGGIEVNNTDDTMTRETLLDAYSWSYSLDNCCAKHGVQGKNKEDTIDNWWLQHGGKGKAVQHLTEIPIDIVGSYNLQDCHATYDLWFAQQPLLEEQGLIGANNIERRLIPWLLKTKRCGIKIDKQRLEELTADVQIQYMRAQMKWEMEYGDVNPSSTKQLTSLFVQRGWDVPLKRGANTPTFEADALTDIDHPIGQQIIELRALKKLLTTYLEGQFPKFMDNGGFLHGELHPAKSDEGGTVTGRFSSAKPNCLGVGTRIFTTEYGYIPIERVREGMHIVTHTGTVRPVKQVSFMGVAQVGYVDKLLCTAHHPILSGDGTEWVGAEICTSYMKEDEDGLYQRYGVQEASSGVLPQCSKAYQETSTGTLWSLFASNSQDFDSGHTVRCVGSGEGSSLLPLEAWGEESYDWKNRRASPLIHWGCGRWPRSFDEKGEWSVLLYTQDCNGRGSWHQCRGPSVVGGRPSYRWQPQKQFPGQLGARNKSGTSSSARYVSVNRRWRPVGILPTFDIEIDGPEHSFVAEGILVHNCQNISAREEKHGKEVRSMFVPVNNAEAIARGYKEAEGWLLGAFDYKQIEYRAFTHFAISCKAPGSDEAYLKFKENPDTDYHEMVQRLMGWFFPDDKARTKVYRHVTKNLNFGSIYGLGAASFAHKFRQPLRMAHPDYKGSLQTLAKELLDTYFEKIPFARFTGQMIQKTAERRGYVQTLGKRRARFPQDKKAYKMVNYLVQGSAGDIIKKAIADSWDAGVWDVLIPHNMVHDELVFSIPDSKEGYEACCKLRDCMVNAYKLYVPIGVDTEIGPDWGHCDGDNWEVFEKKWQE